MTINIAQEKIYTLQEYLSFQEQAQERYEFHNGKLVKTPGGTLDHSTIAVNFATAIKIELKKQKIKSRIGGSDVKIWLEAYNKFVYPDVCVVIGAPHFYKNTKTAIVNPVIIVEVLSKSTSDFDKGTKFEMYRSLPNFQEYILIEQDSAKVYVNFKEGTDLWSFQEVEGLENSLQLKSVPCTLLLADIYEDIDFEKDEAVSDK